MKRNPLVTPVVKWAGGKRQLLSEIIKYIPNKYSTYYEPFIGGGAVLFHLQPRKAVINDINEELVNLYQVIKNNITELFLSLSEHRNEPAYFYATRELDRDKKKFNRLSNVEKASRTLYLNKTCFNGLFRVNSRGEFNVPFGKYKNPDIINEATLKAVSDYFNNADISFLCGDFETSIENIKENDFVYFDPPYDPISESANFTGYSKDGFSKEDQIRLKKLCDKLDDKGVKFLLSNSATSLILDLYKDYHVEIVQARRAINSDGDKRGKIEEVLVKNYN